MIDKILDAEEFIIINSQTLRIKYRDTLNKRIEILLSRPREFHPIIEEEFLIFMNSMLVDEITDHFGLSYPEAYEIIEKIDIYKLLDIK